MKKKDKKKILIIVAHPDDAELMFGGTINRYVRSGNKVDILIVTSGENWNKIGLADSERIKSVRQQESKKAGKILGVNSVSFLKAKDGFVDSEEIIPLLISKVREFNPNIILSHSESEGHTDHKQVSLSVKRICNQEGEPAPIVNPFWNCKENPVTEFEGLLVYHDFNSKVTSKTKYISLNLEDVEKKVKSVLCYKSQFVDKDKVRDRIFTEAHYKGLFCGVDYSEFFDLVTTNLNKYSEILVD